MGDPMQTRETDTLQAAITDLACGLSFDGLPHEDAAAATRRIIDTFAAHLVGFDSHTARVARSFATTRPDPDGATVIGTRLKVAAEAAAFANATASREEEWNDVYMSRGGGGAHPSDVVLPILAAAEHAGASGAAFIAAVVVAYEIYMELSDAATITGFDQSGLSGIGVAAGAGMVMGLSREQIHHAVSIATVANNPLNQTRRNDLSMWKAAAAGQGGMAGVSAALLARHGMEGPSMPFEGVAGWCTHIARNSFKVPPFNPHAARFRIRDSQIKPRASCQVTISSILAAEAAAVQLQGPEPISRVLVETYAFAKKGVGSSPHCWNPVNRESADHSIPYVVAAALTDGSVGPRQFQDDRLWDPAIRALVAKVEVEAEDSFTAAYEEHPRRHRTRVTVELESGKRIVGETGGVHGDLADEPSPEAMSRKFLDLTRDRLGDQRAQTVLARLLDMHRIDDVRALPPLLVIDG